MSPLFCFDAQHAGEGTPACIISEIGAMYEDIDGMLELIKASKDAGADAVKIQTYKAETMAHPDAVFEFEDGRRISQFDFFKKYEISEDDHRRMMRYASEIGITFFSTPSHYDDVDFLDSLGVPAFKTGSDDLTNYPFLEYIAKKGKPMIVSTGMSTLGEIEQAVHTVLEAGNSRLMLLHCTVSYPVAPQYANLLAIRTMQEAFNLPVGYSNHVPGMLAPILAASLGAAAIEVHLTLDRSLKRPDYQVALEPQELEDMIRQIRLTQQLLGNGRKTVSDTEVTWRKNARKSIAAARDMKKGEVLTRKDIKIMRPGTGIPPCYIDFVVGSELKRDVKANALIQRRDL